KKNIGFVVDESCFHSCLTSKDIKHIMKHIYSDWNNSYFDLILEKCNLNINKKISDMSKGMKTKLMLAVALSHDPDLLILDELTSGLDPIMRDELLHVLKEFINNKNKSILFSTHITSDLEKIADYIAFLHKGKLIFVKSLEELQKDFLLIKCSKNNYEQFDKENIFAQYEENEKYILLVNSNLIIDSGTYESKKVPTIDDIMLLHIKGEQKIDWFNKKRFLTY
ncbi:TPA: AAA family ATPase, partial [Clostridioides difficile]